MGKSSIYKSSEVRETVALGAQKAIKKIFLDYRVTLGFGSTGGLDLAFPIIRLSCQYGIHRRGLTRFTILYYPRSGSLPVGALPGTMAGVDIDTLTMEQYLALSRENQAPGVVKPEIGGNVNFEIKSQFMRELREDTFFGNKNEDAHDHIDRVLSIVGLFNIPGVSKDAVMLRVFPFTLTGAAKRWVDRLAPGTINTWDLLKKAFIQRYCPPSKTAKQLEDIHNFTQEGDESLYQAWERYNDLLYKCPTHDINSHQKVNIFYKGLSTMNRQLLDSQGPIPGMTPAQALTAIQNMADHSKKWHDRTTSRNIGSSSSNDGLVALVNKLDNLGRDTKKLKKSVHAIQVGCQICEGPNLDKDFPLNEEVKQIEEVRYGEFGRTTPFNEKLLKLKMQISKLKSQVNTGSTPSAELNTGETERVQRREGKAPMTEEDLQAERARASRGKATMDAEAQKQIHLDELLARRLVEEEEKAANAALVTEFDYIQARLNADQILAEKIQQEEREQYSIEDRETSPRANGCLSKRLAGKELSNPLIADDLLKIIWLSMYHGLTNLNIDYQDWSAMKTSCCQDLKT
ncbi:hypothetical protein Tco_0134247 [Tanacetum coccineum]